jgi:hypothetical protein
MSRRPRLFRRTLLAIMCLLAARRLGAGAANAPCAPSTGETRNQVVDYLRKLAHMPAETTLDLTGSDPEGDTCYRKLEFSMSARPAKMVLYLSTDQTFLSPRLFDLSVDPAEVEAGETADSGASGGASESFARGEGCAHYYCSLFRLPMPILPEGNGDSWEGGPAGRAFVVSSMGVPGAGGNSLPREHGVLLDGG